MQAPDFSSKRLVELWPYLYTQTEWYYAAQSSLDRSRRRRRLRAIRMWLALGALAMVVGAVLGLILLLAVAQATPLGDL